MIGPAALPVLFFVSGPLALVYEVLWQRRFALLFGGGATAAAAVLAAYFAGLGAGSHVFGRSAAGAARPLRAGAPTERLGIVKNRRRATCGQASRFSFREYQLPNNALHLLPVPFVIGSRPSFVPFD